MLTNRLKLNPDKTELNLMGTKHNVDTNPDEGLPMTLQSANVDVANTVYIQGVTLNLISPSTDT